MLISGFLGVAIAFFGIYLSYYFDIASGASVALLSTMIFAYVLLWTRLQHDPNAIYPLYIKWKDKGNKGE